VNLEAVLLGLGVVIALALLGAAILLLRGDYTLRARLVAVFAALTLVPSLLTMVMLWRELQPRAWLAASRGIGGSMESALILARDVLAERHRMANQAARDALERLRESGRAEASALDDLLPARYVAFFCAGDPGTETVRAIHGGWNEQQATQLLRDVLPGRRGAFSGAQLIVAPDSADVVVGVAGPHALAEQAYYAMVIIPVPTEEAQAIAAVVESYRRSQQIGLLEELHVRNAGYILATFAFVFLVVAFAVGAMLARTLTRPIEELQDAFENVAAGNLGFQVTSRPRGEMGHLTDGFNTMSSDLYESHHQLVRATRQAAWQDVARRLAHEIKNPLTPITLSIHRVRTRLASDDTVVQECLDTILEEASHLERLANEFSSFARLPKPKLNRIDPAEVLQQVLDLYAATPNLTLNVRLDGLPAVLADRDQIRQVFTNVVKNAVEAMPRGGDLDVQWSQENGFVAFTFRDAGGGFPDEAGDRVFDPTFTTKPTGSGLGLSIVRRILEDHGGDIQAGNRDEGGAWVRIRLPVAT
jgi:nitrogen fixation/metabolism regulation signal transduction histidine kinase